MNPTVVRSTICSVVAEWSFYVGRCSLLLQSCNSIIWFAPHMWFLPEFCFKSALNCSHRWIHETNGTQSAFWCCNSFYILWAAVALQGPGSEPLYVVILIILRHSVSKCCIKWLLGAFFWIKRQLEHGAKCSAPSGVKVKNVWFYFNTVIIRCIVTDVPSHVLNLLKVLALR